MKSKNLFFSLRNPKYGLPLALLPCLILGAWVISDLFPPKEIKPAIEAEKIEGLNSNLPDPVLSKQKTKFELLQELLSKRKENAENEGLRMDFDHLSEDDQNQLIQMLSNDDSKGSDTPELTDMSGISALDQLQQKYFAEEPAPASDSYASLFNESPKSVQADELAAIKKQLASMDSFMRGEKQQNLEEVEILKATKADQKPTFFNTVVSNKKEQFITAILDEAQTVVDGSRIRIRLLDDIFIGDNLFKKGSYLYGLVSGFSAQRVNVDINSVLRGDRILKTSITLYDNDGIKGLYVPNSDFRELLKRSGQRVIGNNRVSFGGSGSDALQDMFAEMGSDFYQVVTQVVSNRITQNRARLKYASIVYLINEDQIEEKSN